MKIKSTFALLIIFIALLASCKKNDKKTDAPPPKKLKYLTQEIFVDSTRLGVTTTITTYTYDSKKRLTSSHSANMDVTYTYDDSGNIVSINSTSKITTPDQRNQEFTYADGKLSTALERQYTKGVLVYTNNYGFVFNGNNVSELHASGDSANGVTFYTYDNNNDLIKKTGKDSNGNDQVYAMTYDNKKNRFINLSATLKNPFFSTEIPSPNNVLSVSMNGNVINASNYSYDSDGYPISRVITSPGISYKYSYTYTEM